MGKYRKGIVAVIVNEQGKVLIAERSDCKGAWQFPQGGLKVGETKKKRSFVRSWRSLELRRSRFCSNLPARRNTSGPLLIRIILVKNTLGF